jgi:1-aminocyclopropane-1-carboxylate deaminase
MYPALPGRPLSLLLPSPLQELRDDRLADAGLRLYLKREDLINEDIPGNKWRKLKYNIEAARAERRDVLTFGGAYSNHIRAVAAVGYYFGFSTIGLIRGEEHLPLNPSLAYAANLGMRLAYLDRAAYRQKMRPEIIEMLREQFGDFFLLPEGGSNDNAARGCAEIAAEIRQPFDVICCPCGTGGTLAGLAHGLAAGQRALGFAALKGGEFLARQVEELQVHAFGKSSGNWTIEYDFHFGGFAKRKPELDLLIADFRQRHGLSLDWIYTAKMMYGIYALAGSAVLPAGSTVVVLITGPGSAEERLEAVTDRHPARDLSAR